jgi:type 1 glutamine amidotransferase
MRFDVVAASLFVGMVLSMGTADAADRQANDKIRVVIIDGQNNHNWRATTPLLKRALEECNRFKVAVSTSPQPGGQTESTKDTVPFPPDLKHFDVVLSNYNGADWPAPFQKALDKALASGDIGLVIVHAANNSFPGWKEYNRMIGLGWRDAGFGDRLIVRGDQETRIPQRQGPGAGHGPQHPFTITIRDPEHPITKGMPAQWLHAQDELYHGLRGPVENVHLLATALSDKAKGGTGDFEPMILTVSYGKGRVFHTPMGHDLPAMRCVGFITTLRRGTEWAATGKVTLPLPDNFPTAAKTSSIAGP